MMALMSCYPALIAHSLHIKESAVHDAWGDFVYILRLSMLGVRHHLGFCLRLISVLYCSLPGALAMEVLGFAFESVFVFRERAEHEI